MKRTGLLSTITTIVLCSLILMVWAPIPTDLCIPNHLQVQLEQGLENVDHSLGRQDLESNVIPTENHEPSPELSTQLKAIEGFLMEDTNINLLDSLTNHPESDLTSHWNNISKEMHTILAHTDSGIVIESSIPKRRRVTTSKSTELWNMESNPSASRKTSGQDLEANQLDVPASNLGPKRLNISQRSRKDNEKIGAVETGAHGSQLAVYSNYFSEGKSEERLFTYSQFNFRGVVNLLTLKGGIAMWQNPKVLKQIDGFFMKFDKTYISQWSSLNTICNTEKVIRGMERVRKDVVLAYFGGLSIMYHISSIELPIEDLFQIGWRYLETYLKVAFNLSPNEVGELAPLLETAEYSFTDKLLPPNNLIKYILNLGPHSAVRPSLIGALIKKLFTDTMFQTPQCKIEFSTHSFLSAILGEAKLRGRKILSTQFCVLEDENPIKSFNMKSSMIPNTSEIGVNNLRSLITRAPALHLERIGESVLKEQMDFSKDIKAFFKILSKDMKRSLLQGMHSISEKSKIDESKFMLINLTQVQNIIFAVEDSMMPAFLGMTFVIHQNQLTPQVLEVLLETCCDTLKAYLSPWRSHLAEETSSIILNKITKKSNEVNWYTVKDPIHYLCLRRIASLPMEPVWFLYELWYATILRRSVTQGQNLGFEPSPPTKDLTHKILSSMETRGLLS